MNRAKMTRWPAAALALALTPAWTVPLLAGPEDYLMPIERYTSAKAKPLGSTYKNHLVQFYEQVYNCMPWVSIVKNGIGFPKRKGDETDYRYLSVGISVGAAAVDNVGAMAREERELGPL